MITPGQAQRKLESAMEHISHMYGAILRGEIGDTDLPPTENGEPGTAVYHYRAALGYLCEADEALTYHLGTTDGALCPYQDCCWDCGFSEPGYYRCPNCGRVFYARASDSDYADFMSYREDEKQFMDGGYVPGDVPAARDFGPSWGTPEEAWHE